jgi:hypothetical protein
MVKKKDRTAAIQFISDRLEDSNMYDIHTHDDTHVLIIEKPAIAEEPKSIDVILANCVGPAKNFQGKYRANANSQIYTAPILFKDGKTAFVRMVDTNRSWRTDKSLKQYSSQEINQMLHLRKIEKAVMQYFGKRLSYFQPETTNLPESVRDFSMKKVLLDYSHIDPSHQAADFVEDRWSIDYKLPEEVRRITRDAAVKFTGEVDYYWRGHLLPTAVRNKEEDNGQFILTPLK